MEYEEMKKDGPNKNESLLEWERRVKALPLEYI